ncbi:MAG: hypothetical protein V7606_651 [Burkholderiales bacterium]|jgi:hypothetical protein
MLSFALWAVLFTAALTGAGYSHYRYRVIHNQYYEHIFAKNREERFGGGLAPDQQYSRAIPALVLAAVCVMAPMALAI